MKQQDKFVAGFSPLLNSWPGTQKLLKLKWKTVGHCMKTWWRLPMLLPKLVGDTASRSLHTTVTHSRGSWKRTWLETFQSLNLEAWHLEMTMLVYCSRMHWSHLLRNKKHHAKETSRTLTPLCFQRDYRVHCGTLQHCWAWKPLQCSGETLFLKVTNWSVPRTCSKSWTPQLHQHGRKWAAPLTSYSQWTNWTHGHLGTVGLKWNFWKIWRIPWRRIWTATWNPWRWMKTSTCECLTKQLHFFFVGYSASD